MKLPEAIALMLAGKVMVAGGSFVRAEFEELADSKFARFSMQAECFEWSPLLMEWMDIDGWREATPEELKEIGL